MRSEKVTKLLKIPPKAPKSEPKSRFLSETVLSDAVGVFSEVELLLFRVLAISTDVEHTRVRRGGPALGLGETETK